jgi:hypothetical protein
MIKRPGQRVSPGPLKQVFDFVTDLHTEVTLASPRLMSAPAAQSHTGASR